jgi:hypothetical protein
VIRDLRDPSLLGLAYWALRNQGFAPSEAATVTVNNYEDHGILSNDPADHHSKTPQDAPVESDGGS